MTKLCPISSNNSNCTSIQTEENSVASGSCLIMTIEEDRIGLKLTMTKVERIFSTFIGMMLEEYSAQENDLNYIGTSQPMQQGFNDWIAKTYTDQFSNEELNLVILVSSIWSKTKKLVEGILHIEKNEEVIIDEQKWQISANELENKLHLEGKQGKVFTARQVKLIIDNK